MSVTARVEPAEKELEKMVETALVWCATHGLVVGDRSHPRAAKVPGVGLVHAPFSLLPASFPLDYWRQACELAPIFNELVDRVSLDVGFLHDCLSRTKKADAFTSRLLEIHTKLIEEGKKEDIRLGLHRSDYMLDGETKLLLQIEMNTISTAMPGLSSLVNQLHRTLIKHYGEEIGLNIEKLPENNVVDHYAAALAKAWTLYDCSSAVIMTVVHPEERNMYDQHFLSVALRERYGLTSIRKTFTEIQEKGHLRQDGTLIVDGQIVSVVYLRTGYNPYHYLSEAAWEARVLIERSSAIKCPSVSYQLVGTKKIQQELARPKVLERFLDNEEDIKKVRKCFAGLWSLDDDEVVKRAIAKPEVYVLKPQREGGGHNIYGNDLREMLIRLQEEGGEESAAYILMQKIFPTPAVTHFVTDGVHRKEQAVPEVGVFGAYLRNKAEVILNEPCGYLVRTKPSKSTEGGVLPGFAVLDSVYLT